MDVKDALNFDEAMANIKEFICPMLFSYYSGFLNAGFNEEQAMRLTLNYQALALMKKSDDESES